MDRVEMGGIHWALVEANRLRIEILRSREPGWHETLEETAAYLANLGKTPIDYVEAWLSFRPVIEGLRPSPAEAVAGSGWSAPRGAPIPAAPSDPAGSPGGRWFVG